MVSSHCRYPDSPKSALLSLSIPCHSTKKGFDVFRRLNIGTVEAFDPCSNNAWLAWTCAHRFTMLQVGKRRIDFVYEGRDSIEVKMPPPRHMREAALKASGPLLLPSALMQASFLLDI